MDLAATLDAVISLSGEVNRVHLGRKQKAPAGASVKVGPRGGRYYEVPKGGHPGRAIGERARVAWRAKYGEKEGGTFGQKPPKQELKENYEAIRQGLQDRTDQLRGQGNPVKPESTAEFRDPAKPPKDRSDPADNVTQGPWKGPQDQPVNMKPDGPSFTTRMGSTYEFKDGRSRRDGGDWSDATVFLRPGDARVAAQWQGEAKSNKRVHLVGDELLLTSYNNTQGRQVVDERIMVASREPKGGLGPLELFGSKGDGRARSFSDARQGTPIK